MSLSLLLAASKPAPWPCLLGIGAVRSGHCTLSSGSLLSTCKRVGTIRIVVERRLHLHPFKGLQVEAIPGHPLEEDPPPLVPFAIACGGAQPTVEIA